MQKIDGSSLDQFLEQFSFEDEKLASQVIIRIDQYVCPKGPAEPPFEQYLQAFLALQPISFKELQSNLRWTDQGVYAIQYHGPLEIYAPIASTQYPIYIGSASAASLFGRLKQHHLTITRAGLDPADFTFRILPLKWMALSVEALLIERLQPAWNKAGFGHRPGQNTTRAGNRVPQWHTLHPDLQAPLEICWQFRLTCN